MKKLFIILYASIILVGCINVPDKENKGGDDLIPISKEKIEKLSQATKIVIRTSSCQTIIKTISNDLEISIIVQILSNSVEVRDEVVTAEGNDWYIDLFDVDDNIFLTISIWKSGYIGFQNDKEYGIGNLDELNILLEILD